MKRRRLPETDIANLAFLPASHKRRVLSAWLDPKKGRGSYDPQRLTMSDVVNEQLPLVSHSQSQTTWDKLEAIVTVRCRGNELLLAMNLPVARASHAFAAEKEIRAFKLDARPLNFPHCDSYEFALPLVITYEGSPRLIFLDLRRSGNLSLHGRRIVWSAQHVRIRERYPELSDAGLEIWRYRNTQTRSIDALEHDGTPLYSHNELAGDFAETYAIMNELRREMAAGFKAANDGDYGPLFGAGNA